MIRRALLAPLLVLLATAAAAQDLDTMTGELPGPLTEVGFDQRPGEQLPLDLTLTDATGAPVKLASLFGERPVILVPVYYTCPMLCGMVLNGLTTSLRTLPFDAGREFEVVAFSFDPSDTAAEAAARKATVVERYDRGDEGWHFLTGDAETIARLTAAIGFRYAFNPESEEFAHAAGLVIATPQGRIARQFFGVEYAPRDLRLGLVEAADEQIGGLVDQVLLYCFHYDPATGRYSAFTLNLVRLGGAVTLVALALFLFVMLRWERRQRRSAGDPPVTATGLGPGPQPGPGAARGGGGIG